MHEPPGEFLDFNLHLVHLVFISPIIQATTFRTGNEQSNNGIFVILLEQLALKLMFSLYPTALFYFPAVCVFHFLSAKQNPTM